MCCPLRSMIPSPVTDRYRNKSEFTAGVSMDGLKTVGYRIGKYRYDYAWSIVHSERTRTARLNSGH